MNSFIIYLWIILAIVDFFMSIKSQNYLSANFPFFIYLFSNHFIISFITDISIGLVYYYWFMKTSG